MYKVLFSFVLLYSLESWKYVLDSSKKFMLHSFASSAMLCLSILKIGQIDNIVSPDLAKGIAFIAGINCAVFMVKKMRRPLSKATI